jgi:hypothetical protein
MTTFEEHFQMGLLAIEKLKPGFREKMARMGYNPQPADLPDETDLTHDAPSLMTAALPDYPPLQEDYPQDIPSLDDIIERTGEFAPGSVILGICEDGLPFVLDLANPAPGALLAAGDEGSGKTHFLQSVLESARLLNSPEEVAFSLILSDPQEYLAISKADHCMHCLPADDESAGEIIQELTELAEQRRHGYTGGPTYLLGIDDLEDCLHNLDEQDFSRLYWLIRHGPRSRIWTIATLRPDNSDLIDPRFLTAFRTRIIGQMKDHNLAGYLAGDEEMDCHDLEAGIQFLLPFGGAWLPIWICDPQQEQ